MGEISTPRSAERELLARRPDHYRNFTAISILLMALLGGLSGEIIRDVLLNACGGLGRGRRLRRSVLRPSIQRLERKRYRRSPAERTSRCDRE